MNKSQSGPAPQPERREFLRQITAVALGAAAGGVPLAAGVVTMLDPLHKKSSTGGFRFVASLQALPEDGLPRKFDVIADLVDAWNRVPNVPIGAVYLRRTGPATVEALNVICPHLGCFVEFKAQRGSYLCPCHLSSFSLDGAISNANSPSPRAMDTLDAKIRNQTEVWVKFQNYQTGKAAKVLKA